MLSPAFITWVERLIYPFIWGSKWEKIKRLTIIRSLEEGGLGSVIFQFDAQPSM